MSTQYLRILGINSSNEETHKCLPSLTIPPFSNKTPLTHSLSCPFGCSCRYRCCWCLTKDSPLTTQYLPKSLPLYSSLTDQGTFIVHTTSTTKWDQVPRGDLFRSPSLSILPRYTYPAQSLRKGATYKYSNLYRYKTFTLFIPPYYAPYSIQTVRYKIYKHSSV